MSGFDGRIIRKSSEEDVNEANEYFAKVTGMERFLRRQLSEIGVSNRGINALVMEFKNFTYDEDDFGFTDEAKKAQIADLYRRWEAAL